MANLLNCILHPDQLSHMPKRAHVVIARLENVPLTSRSCNYMYLLTEHQ